MGRTPDDVTIRTLAADDIGPLTRALSDVLVDCVEGGASVSFMAPLAREKADRFWDAVAGDVRAGTRFVLIAERCGAIVGTVQLVLGLPENQPHRGDVAKMLVRRDARKRGVGSALMLAVERMARELGKTLLVLDTANDDAERVYRALGWEVAGRIPGFALLPDGRSTDTTFLFRRL